MTTSELLGWLGRFDECSRALLDAPSPVHRDVAERHMRECRAQYRAYMDARPATDRGFVDLPGLAS